MRAAGQVTDAEHELYEGLAGALNEREVRAMVRGLRKLVDGRTAGEAIARRRGSSTLSELRARSG